MTDEAPRPPLSAKPAPAKPKPARKHHIAHPSKDRAPFLPNEDHPHGWLAAKSLKVR